MLGDSRSKKWLAKNKIISHYQERPKKFVHLNKFLVACTRLYKLLCRPVGQSVRPSVRPSVANCVEHSTCSDLPCSHIRLPNPIHSLSQKLEFFLILSI